MKNVFFQQKLNTFCTIKKLQIEGGGELVVLGIDHSWLIIFIKLIQASKDVLQLQNNDLFKWLEI
jgi:hypothetical protein